jgi:1-aminocyclopropane-1-carboxylate deaminase
MTTVLRKYHNYPYSFWRKNTVLYSKTPMINPQLITLEQQFHPSVLTPIREDFLAQHGIELWLKRDDLLHPIISGNKWRKLKYSLNHALSRNKNTLISMGGAYSNHLHALAFVGNALNLQTKAFIRGEKPTVLNPTLQDLLAWKMELAFISRSDYRMLRNFKTHDALPNLKNTEYWLPEGGALALALQGVAELVSETNLDYDVICAACGTGTTLAGIINAVPKDKQIIGFSALKGADFLSADIQQILRTASPFKDWQSYEEHKNWQIKLNYHSGGFAKTTPALLGFMKEFEQRHAIALEPIYTGKMLFGLYDLIAQNYFQAGQKIIAIHTGGLQGNRGFRNEI